MLRLIAASGPNVRTESGYTTERNDAFSPLAAVLLL